MTNVKRYNIHTQRRHDRIHKVSGELVHQPVGAETVVLSYHLLSTEPLTLVKLIFLLAMVTSVLDNPNISVSHSRRSAGIFIAENIIVMITIF